MVRLLNIFDVQAGGAFMKRKRVPLIAEPFFIITTICYFPYLIEA
jgi:hypothetical protein